MEERSLNHNCCDAAVVFGQNIKYTRTRQQMTLSQLAEKTQYDRGCLSRLEYGTQNITLRTAVSLAKALDASFPALFSRNYLSAERNESSMNLSGFRDDDYLLLFVENVRRELKLRNIRQMRIYIDSGIAESVVSRIMKRKEDNPTLRTLSQIAAAVNKDLSFLLSRNIQTETEEI